MFYSMFAHSKKRNPNSATFQENTKLEIVWTIVPFLILVLMAIPASNTLMNIYKDVEGDINIQVVGYQWKWQYKYLEDDIDFFQTLRLIGMKSIINLEDLNKLMIMILVKMMKVYWMILKNSHTRIILPKIKQIIC